MVQTLKNLLTLDLQYKTIKKINYEFTHLLSIYIGKDTFLDTRVTEIKN